MATVTDSTTTARTEPGEHRPGRRKVDQRAAQAAAFVDTAELVADVDDEASPHVAAALAVLAGIAASDAACCYTLGHRPRGQDQRQAVDLLSAIEPQGRAMGRDLARLLDIKDNAHYGVAFVSSAQARQAVSWARRLLSAVDELLRG